MSESNKSVVVLDSQTVPWKKFSKEVIETYRKAVFKEGTDAEFDVFLSMVYKTGLDPLARQIYAIKLQGKVSTIASIDGLRLVAERSGKYAGQVGPFWCGEDGQWKDVWLDKKPPAAARVGILRQDFKDPCWGIAVFKSYSRPSPTWDKMPDVMIAKCAESLGLRKAFPMELSGIYSEEEMDQAINVTPEPKSVQSEPIPVEAVSVQKEDKQRTYSSTNPKHYDRLIAFLDELGPLPIDASKKSKIYNDISNALNGIPLDKVPEQAPIKLREMGLYAK